MRTVKMIVKDLTDNNNPRLNKYEGTTPDGRHFEIKAKKLAKNNFELLKELCEVLEYKDMY